MVLPEEVLEVLRWHRARLIASNHPGTHSGLVFPSLGRARQAPPVSAVPVAAGSLEEAKRAYFREYRRKKRAEKRTNQARGTAFISPSALDKPFADIAEKAGIAGKVTAKAMRRTFNDLARKAQVHDLVLRSVTGHRTVEMQNLYSTVDGEEKRAGLAKVIKLFRAEGSSLVPGEVEQVAPASPKSGPKKTIGGPGGPRAARQKQR